MKYRIININKRNHLSYLTTHMSFLWTIYREYIIVFIKVSKIENNSCTIKSIISGHLYY